MEARCVSEKRAAIAATAVHGQDTDLAWFCRPDVPPPQEERGWAITDRNGDVVVDQSKVDERVVGVRAPQDLGGPNDRLVQSRAVP